MDGLLAGWLVDRVERVDKVEIVEMGSRTKTGRSKG